MKKKTMQETLAEINSAVYKHADEALQEVQKSKWTGALLILIGLFFIVAVVAILAYLF